MSLLLQFLWHLLMVWLPVLAAVCIAGFILYKKENKSD